MISKRHGVIIMLLALVIIAGAAIFILTKKEDTPADYIEASGNTVETDDGYIIINGENIKITPNISDKVINGFDEYENQTYPLIAAIPAKKILLYGVKPKGVVLFKDGAGQYFDWDYMTPRGILPQIAEADFDNDGKDEIGVSLYWGSGTGVSVEQLHILDMAEDDLENQYYIDNQFMDVDYAAQLKEMLQYQYEPDTNMLTLKIRGITYEYFCSRDFVSLEYGSHINFEFINNNITAIFLVGIVYDGSVIAEYEFDPLVVAVEYKNGAFTLTDAEFGEYYNEQENEDITQILIGEETEQFLFGEWQVTKFLGFDAITKEDIEWPDGEKIIGKTIVINKDLFSAKDFGTEYSKYAVEIPSPSYEIRNEQKGFELSRYLSLDADETIRSLDNEDIVLMIQAADMPDGNNTASPAFYVINNNRLLISLNCNYFELEKISE